MKVYWRCCINMSKRKCKKNKIDMGYSDLRVYKDNCRPVMFMDKRRKEKYKRNWMLEV